MGKQNFLFLTFCLILTTGLMHSYAVFKEHFSPHQEDQQTIHRLQTQVEERNLRVAELENQIVDLQQEVAAQLPAMKKIKKAPQTFPMRSLASVMQKPAEGFELSESLLEKARAEFRRGDFKNAGTSFSQVVRKYPTSPLVVQAYFFWGESLFLNGRHQECLDVVDQMMIQFPDNELTGFLMLRMGQILQSRNRGEEAGEVFRLVSRSFSFNHELKTQADQLARSIEM